MMKNFLILIFVVLQVQLLFSQRNALPCTGYGDDVSLPFHQKNYELAKARSDKCIAFNRWNYVKYPRTWYYRGLVYQKFYEDFDSLNESFEKKYFKNLSEADIQFLYGRLTKDTTFEIAVESYLKCICSIIKNDTLNYERIINDSIYRKHNIEKFKTLEFANDKYIAPLKDTILPKILEYLNNGTLRNWDNEQIYIDIFTGIIENPRKNE